VSTPSAPLSQHTIPESDHRQPVDEFLRWAIAQVQQYQQSDRLGLGDRIGLGKLGRKAGIEKNQNKPLDSPPDVIRLPLSENDQTYFDGQTELIIEFSVTATESKSELATLENRLGRWLIKKLHAHGPAVPARPREQPQAVQDITSTLFSAYQIEGGQLHLGGCQLTDHPFLRLSYPAQKGYPVTSDFPTSADLPIPNSRASLENCGAQPSATKDICHLFVGPDGSWVPDSMVLNLGLLDIEPIDDLPPRIDKSAIDALLSAGRRIASQRGLSDQRETAQQEKGQRDPNTLATDPIAATVIWVKHADGHLQFTIGDVSTTLVFSNWAKLLKPPPYLCEYSKTSTYHLAATDDGRIDAWDQIACCQQSGQRVLKQDLLECCVTGQQVLSQFTEICPVSGMPYLSDESSTCKNCQQRVSKAAIDNNQCTACRQLSKLPKDDPRLLWLLGEHPGLRHWKRWKLSETEQVYIAEASHLFKRLLVVADKQTLDVLYMATLRVFSRGWKAIPKSMLSKFLA
jgi:hypothetical protein